MPMISLNRGGSLRDSYTTNRINTVSSNISIEAHNPSLTKLKRIWKPLSQGYNRSSATEIEKQDQTKRHLKSPQTIVAKTLLPFMVSTIHLFGIFMHQSEFFPSVPSNLTTTVWHRKNRYVLFTMEGKLSKEFNFFKANCFLWVV